MWFILLSLLSSTVLTAGDRVVDLNNEIDYYLDNLNDGIFFLVPKNDRLQFNSFYVVLENGLLRWEDPAVLIVKDDQLLFSASIGIKSAEAGVSWSVFEVSAELYEITQKLEFEIFRNGKNCTAFLTSNTSFHLGDIELNIKGPFSLIFYPLIKAIKSLFGLSTINHKVNNIIKDYLNKPVHFYCNKVFKTS